MAQFCSHFDPYVSPSAKIARSAIVEGDVRIGANTMICPGATIKGPVWIGANCMIGNNTMLRGPLRIAAGSRIGLATELKNAVIGTRVLIGPMCYVADSVVDSEAYLGAMVRTSNQRLDRNPVSAMYRGSLRDTGLDKLGAYIGAKASLGIQVIILPGRIVAPGSIFGPRITIERNLPAARYTLKQELRVSALS
ncbi:MAG: acetyltransferase [Candidatus Pacebacteria bacterium]|nr:acetyltransferase [Candidatus Paceibacterota bacterium]